MNKKNLTKLALMGFLVASTEATVNAAESNSQTATLLASGCKTVAWQQAPSYPNSGGGCHAYQNQGNQDQNGYYYQETQPAACRTMNSAPSQGMQHSCGKGSCGQKPYSNGQQMMQQPNAQNYTSMNNRPQPVPQAPPGFNNYTSNNDSMKMSNPDVAESKFMSNLSAENKQTYLNLTPQGRAMAINLVNQGKEANAAVKEAAEQTKATSSSSTKY